MRHPPARNDFDGWVAQLGVGPCRQRAKQYLQQSGPDALPALRRGLHHSRAIVRAQCAGILDRLVDDASLPDLVAALDDPDTDVVRRALHALACDTCKDGACRPGEDEFVPKAIELLRHDNADLRAGAIDALGRAARRSTDASIVAALTSVSENDPDRGLRGMARYKVELLAKRR